MCLRCQIDWFLEALCTCESYFTCEWHQRLQKEEHADVLQAMEEELSDRHLAYAIEKGFVDSIGK